MSKFEIKLLRYIIRAEFIAVYEIYERNPRLLLNKLIRGVPCMYECDVQLPANIEEDFNLETLGWHVFSTEGIYPKYQYCAKYPNFVFNYNLHILYGNYVLIYKGTRQYVSNYLPIDIYNKYDNYYYVSNVIAPSHKIPKDCKTLVIYNLMFNTSLMSMIGFMKNCLEYPIMNEQLNSVYFYEEPVINQYEVEDMGLRNNRALKNLLENPRLSEIIRLFHDKYPQVKIRFNRRLNDKNIMINKNQYCEVNINKILQVLKYEYTS